MGVVLAAAREGEPAFWGWWCEHSWPCAAWRWADCPASASPCDFHTPWSGWAAPGSPSSSQIVSVDRSVHRVTGCIQAPQVSLTTWTHTHFPSCFCRHKWTQSHRLYPGPRYHWPSGPTLTSQTVPVDTSVHRVTVCVHAPPVSLIIWTHTRCTQSHRRYPGPTSITDHLDPHSLPKLFL